MNLIIKHCNKCGGCCFEKDEDGDLICLYCGKIEYATKPLPFVNNLAFYGEGKVAYQNKPPSLDRQCEILER